MMCMVMGGCSSESTHVYIPRNRSCRPVAVCRDHALWLQRAFKVPKERTPVLDSEAGKAALARSVLKAMQREMTRD